MRHTKEVTITEPGRDQGKIFVLTELPSEPGEIWATRALELLETAGFVAASEQKQNGMAGLAAAMPAFSFKVARALQDPTLDEMWQHVRFQPSDPRAPPQDLFKGDACQIQEWTTRLRLRFEYFRLHTGFFSREKASTSKEASAA
jgi:hypothetical protein